MQLYDLMIKRRSVRHFADRPVPEEIVEALVAAANNAPTGGNIQPWSIILVQGAEGRAELSGIVGGQPWGVYGAVAYELVPLDQQLFLPMVSRAS